ncbi:unnamed protein product [Rotaria sp. Silwood1]|nr:unnamed protein product [Rotaria sp. Silwood1]CAF3659665.1 unnamed protein product [Rotaria sp. Silwood1]CAF4755933.1 unnamed protein product [Rotaria sp. Silwood1]
MDNQSNDNKIESLYSFHTKENDTVELFNELLPWTFNCRTLIDAARNGQTAECEDLIRLGVDINECDNYGNTAVWTSYFHEHLDTLFTLLQLGADPNTRSGDILCSDLHRACSFGDQTLTEILIECGGYVNISDRNGKTPLIYALEYPSSNSVFDLISYLIEHGAHINFKDQNGLTPLHYACYRGDYETIKLLIDHKADISIENAIGYNILRYALSCLFYTSPSQYIQYENRLKIIDLLINQYKIDSSLYDAIIGNNNEQIHIFPLFDFIFYSLIKKRYDLEKFAWNIFLNINITNKILNNIQIIIQNTFIYSYYFSHIIYLCQRFKIENFLSLLIYYIEHITYDNKPNRFYLLLYIIYIDNGLKLFQLINNYFNKSLFYTRQYILENFLNKCQEKPEKLKFYCRRYIRTVLSISIHCKLEKLDLNNYLKNYILIDELNFISIS